MKSTINFANLTLEIIEKKVFLGHCNQPRWKPNPTLTLYFHPKRLIKSGTVKILCFCKNLLRKIRHLLRFVGEFLP